MKREQLDKINGLLNQIADLKKIEEIKSELILVSEYILQQDRQPGSAPQMRKGQEVLIDREILQAAVSRRIIELKADLKDAGFEDE